MWEDILKQNSEQQLIKWWKENGHMIADTDSDPMHFPSDEEREMRGAENEMYSYITKHIEEIVAMIKKDMPQEFQKFIESGDYSALAFNRYWDIEDYITKHKEQNKSPYWHPPERDVYDGG